MLSTLFYMQAVGALAANVITVVITIILHDIDFIPSDNASCNAECIASVDMMWRWIVGLGAIPPAVATLLRWSIPESPRFTMEVEKNPEQANRDVQTYFSKDPLPQSLVTEAGPSNAAPDNDEFSPNGTRRPSSGTLPTLKFGEAFEMGDISLEEPAIPFGASSEPAKITLRKDSWKEFWSGFHTFFVSKGNWTDLAGTSLSWMMLDFAFYCLSVNNPMILDKLWNNEDVVVSVYTTLLGNGYRALLAVSTGSMIGGGLFIVMNRHRWALQYYGFWILAGIFVIVGVCFVTLVGTRYFAAVIVLFSLASLFFDFGPNTSTYVVSDGAIKVWSLCYRLLRKYFQLSTGRPVTAYLPPLANSVVSLPKSSLATPALVARVSMIPIRRGLDGFCSCKSFSSR
jgi:MFS transporter, PHS family, inorganic phosphate transporter